MGALRTPRHAWIDEALRTLGRAGVDAVRIEPLAKALGVSKGGFYGFFANRHALLEEMLDAWERMTVDDVLEQVRREGGDALDQARHAGQLTFSSDILPIDLAVRDWARRDADVAERLRRVDSRRMQVVRDAVRTFCSDPIEVEARSLLAFCMSIGVPLIAADHAGLDPIQVRSHASALILNRVWPDRTGPDGTPVGPADRPAT